MQLTKLFYKLILMLTTLLTFNLGYDMLYMNSSMYFPQPANHEAALVFTYHTDILYYLWFVFIIIIYFFFFSILDVNCSKLHHYFLYLLKLLFISIQNKDFNFFLLHKNRYTISNFLSKKKAYRFDSCSLLECGWTILPGLFLMDSAIPGMTLLYGQDTFIDPAIILKITGNQWYWHYDYGVSCFNVNFDSNLDSDYSNYNRVSGQVNNNFEFSEFTFDRDFSLVLPSLSSCLTKLNQVLCESICVLISWYDKQDPSLTRVDNPVFLPLNTKIRVLTTSNDVIHSWALPAAALKVDSIPGRLNQFDLQISKRGVFRGQCSEFCGVGHAFMPIVVVSVLPEDFDYFLLCWVNHLNSDSSLNLLR